MPVSPPSAISTQVADGAEFPTGEGKTAKRWSVAANVRLILVQLGSGEEVKTLLAIPRGCKRWQALNDEGPTLAISKATLPELFALVRSTFACPGVERTTLLTRDKCITSTRWSKTCESMRSCPNAGGAKG